MVENLVSTLEHGDNSGKTGVGLDKKTAAENVASARR
jgi:hypothetical protein